MKDLKRSEVRLGGLVHDLKVLFQDGGEGTKGDKENINVQCSLLD